MICTLKKKLLGPCPFLHLRLCADFNRLTTNHFLSFKACNVSCSWLADGWIDPSFDHPPSTRPTSPASPGLGIFNATGWEGNISDVLFIPCWCVGWSVWWELTDANCDKHFWLEVAAYSSGAIFLSFIWGTSQLWGTNVWWGWLIVEKHLFPLFYGEERN